MVLAKTYLSKMLAPLTLIDKLLRRNTINPSNDSLLDVKPHFDSATLACFNDCVQRSKVYLEYGLGGSTIVALKYAKSVVSVETDIDFARKFESSLKRSELEKCKIIHANIGPTRLWGKPKLAVWPIRYLWDDYAKIPWTYLKGVDLVPDFILVDGRFRVASVLYSLLSLPDESETSILLDDCTERDYCGPILPYIEVLESPGRSLLFKRNRSNFDRKACEMAFRRHKRDWR